MWEKFKRFFEDTELFTALLFVCVGLIAFGLGRLSAENAQMSHRGQAGAVHEPAFITEHTTTTPAYVASENSTKYHLPWCPSASRIKEANKITFASKAEAEAAGYEPAANCKGI